MSLAVPFKDIYKPWKDFHTKSFASSKHKVELRSGSTEFSFSKGPLSDPEVSVKSYCDPLNSSIKAKGLSTGSFEVTTEWKDKAKGLTLTDTLLLGASGAGAWSVSGQYDLDNAVITGEITASAKKAAKVGIVTKVAGLLVGGQADMLFGGTPNITVGFRAHHNEYHLGAIGDLKTVQAGLLYKNYGVELKLLLANMAHVIGIGWASNFAKVRAEFPTGLLQVAVREQIKKGVILTVSGEGNLLTHTGAKWGMNIEILESAL